MVEANTTELLYPISVSKHRDHNSCFGISFAAKANANAILYIFHFQTLYTVFLGAHMWQRLTQVNHSTLVLTSRSRDIIIYIFPSFATEANANAILYIFHF